MQTTTERELPMLAGIAGFFRWLEELLNILNGPLLMFGAGIALVDLLTDGALTATDKALLFAWAISQALGIDLQLLACFARARMAMLKRFYWALVGWIVLGIPLAVATWQAGYVYALQQSEHISESAALAEAGMDRRTWLAWRVGLAVLLVCLAGWTRYVAPRINAEQSAEEERQKLESELVLEPLRAQLRATQLRGARTVAADARGVLVAAVKGQKPTIPQPPLPLVVSMPVTPATRPPSPDDPTRPPTGGGMPASHDVTQEASAQADSAFGDSSYEPDEVMVGRNGRKPVNLTRRRAAKQTRGRVVRDGLTKRQRQQIDDAYAALDEDPEMTTAALARRIGSGWKQAQRFRTSWTKQQQRQQHAAQ